MKLLLSALLISIASSSESESSSRPQVIIPRLPVEELATKVAVHRRSLSGTGGGSHTPHSPHGKDSKEPVRAPVLVNTGVKRKPGLTGNIGLGMKGLGIATEIPRTVERQVEVIRPGSLTAAVVAAVKAPTLVITDGTDRLAGIISAFGTTRPVGVPYALGIDELGNAAGTVLSPWYPRLTPLDSDRNVFEKIEEYFFAESADASRGKYGAVMGPFVATIGGTPHANVLIKTVKKANGDASFYAAFFANAYNGGVRSEDSTKAGNEWLHTDLGVFRFIKEVEYQRKAAEIIPGRVPEIYGAWLVSRSADAVMGVMAMAKVPGKSFQQLYETATGLREAITGTNHEELCRLLARDLIRPLLAAGIIHDDTHIGNVMVHNELHRGREADCFVTQTEGCKLYLIDFGKARPYIASERAVEAGGISNALTKHFGCHFSDE